MLGTVARIEIKIEVDQAGITTDGSGPIFQVEAGRWIEAAVKSSSQIDELNAVQSALVLLGAATENPLPAAFPLRQPGALADAHTVRLQERQGR